MSDQSFARKLLHALRRFAVNAEYRRDFLWYHLPRPAGVFQLSGDTEDNRFPRIFRFVEESLWDDAEARLLSFGCSTGEEVFTLREYLPLAAIDGIDANPYRIRVCRRRLRRRGGDPRLTFSVAASPEHLAAASYDAVFCMAVLRHGALQFGPPPRCDHLITFAAFETIVGDLARVLKPGGLLAIAFSNFRFADTATAAEFDTVMQFGGGDPDPRTPLFGRDDCRLLGTGYADVLFRKHLTQAAAGYDSVRLPTPVCQR